MIRMNDSVLSGLRRKGSRTQMSSLATAKRVFQRRGLNGVLSAFRDRFLMNKLGRKLDWCYGRAIELRGNTVKIDDCVFSLNSPMITTSSKSKFMFDQYEQPEREAVQRFLNPDLPVVEFGASIGVVSCLTNRRLSQPQNHVVVEANPALLTLLNENRNLNECQFSVLPRVIGYDGTHMSFYVNNDNFVVSSAVPSEGGEALEKHEVRTTSLESILKEYGFETCTLICDIEGGESDLVRHESDVLKNHVSTLILEVHEWSLGKTRVEEIFAELAELGFNTVSAELDTYTFQKRI